MISNLSKDASAASISARRPLKTPLQVWWKNWAQPRIEVAVAWRIAAVAAGKASAE